MEGSYVWLWTVLSIIGIATAIRVIILVLHGRNHAARTSRSADQGTAPAHLSASPRTGTTETGPMVYYANSRHGRCDKEYRFNYKQVYDSQFGKITWRAYILRMPSLRGRNSDAHTTHRWHDSNNNYWVCWDRPVNSLKEIQAISRAWADHIQEYIATGKRFG